MIADKNTFFFWIMIAGILKFRCFSFFNHVNNTTLIPIPRSPNRLQTNSFNFTGFKGISDYLSELLLL
jgi:hypothetical protein